MSLGITIADTANEEHEALKRHAVNQVNFKIKTADQAFAEYREGLIKLLRDARQEVDDDRTIQTKCAECGRMHRMRSTVSHYQCPCDPHTDRFPFNERVVLGAGE